MALIEIDRQFAREVAALNGESVLVYLVLAALLLTSPSAYLLTNHLTAQLLTWDTNTIIHHLLHIAGSYPLVGTLVVVLFWTSVGLLAYLCYLALANAFAGTYNDAVIDTRYANAGSWRDHLSAPITQAIFGLALIGFVLISWVLYSKCLVPFSTSLVNWQPQYLLKESLFVLLIAIDLYLIRLLAILTFSVE